MSGIARVSPKMRNAHLVLDSRSSSLSEALDHPGTRTVYCTVHICDKDAVQLLRDTMK